ncbi:winged helix-turn-helix domain-containing protein [Roseomonas elaeocarpi]|uniref:Winged helix-turn-helix domain-containing protein n=1 Tax=Roseomonas elaeocarpi TaxID=907779 RepID=A0ABV6JNP7_9PROT
MHDSVPPRRLGGYVLDNSRATLLDPHGQPVALRPKSFALLNLLLDHSGRLVRREQILEALWPGLNVSDDSITQCISEIRRALGQQGVQLLRTVPRRGYILELRFREDAASPSPPSEAGAAPAAPGAPPEGDAALPGSGPAPDYEPPGQSAMAGEAPAGQEAAHIAPSDEVPGRASIAPAGEVAIGTVPITTAPIGTAPIRMARGGTRPTSRAPGGPTRAGAETGEAAAWRQEPARRIASRLAAWSGPRAWALAGLLVAGAAGAMTLRLDASAPPEPAAAEAPAGLSAASRPDLVATSLSGPVAPAAVVAPAVLSPTPVASASPSPLLQAQQLYDKGRELAYRPNGLRRENWQGARAFFEQAIAVAPDFAPAYVEAVFTHTNMATSGLAADPAAELRAAEALVREAAVRAPDRADVQSARGAVLRLQRRSAEAMEAYRRAVALDPGQHASRANIGLMLILTGHPEAAAEPIRTSLALTGPTHPYVGTWLTYLGIAALQMDEGDRGATLFQQSLERQAFLPPDTRRLWLASALALSGQGEEARALLAEVRSRQPALSATALRRGELSDDPTYLARQEVFYRGLALAGLPE